MPKDDDLTDEEMQDEYALAGIDAMTVAEIAAACQRAGVAPADFWREFGTGPEAVPVCEVRSTLDLCRQRSRAGL